MVMFWRSVYGCWIVGVKYANWYVAVAGSFKRRPCGCSDVFSGDGA